MDRIRCDTCEAEAATFARGWRAYVVELGTSLQIVHVVCPACAELYGEDEAPLADTSRSD